MEGLYDCVIVVGLSVAFGQELSIVQRDGAYITPETDRERLNTLLWRDDAAGARRELSRVTNDIQRVAQARLELRTSPAAGQRVAAGLPGDLSADPEFHILGIGQAGECL